MSPCVYNKGDRITNERAFTSPIGVHFPAGTVFIVVHGGTPGGRSIMLYAERCGSIAWISDGLFLGTNTNKKA